MRLRISHQSYYHRKMSTSRRDFVFNKLHIFTSRRTIQTYWIKTSVETIPDVELFNSLNFHEPLVIFHAKRKWKASVQNNFISKRTSLYDASCFDSHWVIIRRSDKAFKIRILFFKWDFTNYLLKNIKNLTYVNFFYFLLSLFKFSYNCCALIKA